ncbi:MAG: HAMP domain-containing protein [Calditrichaeota bacterium]|nr:MAG: HAMP domain-containing protein [Calditrichota bacterium]MBL1206794.1 HAMP domain-containing protein [Calditrichota bacterium]NOG46622.1 HAMP domain-containing protein [Calditrichota bacterium]
MKRFFTSFYGKLSALFLILLLVMGTVQILLTISSWQTHHNEADQQLNARLAEDVAKDFNPLLKDSLDIDAIHHVIHYMMVINPKIEIYLLDEQGGIMAFFAEPQKKVKVEQVELEAIKEFLSPNRQLPILGVDPRNPGITKPFSAARLQIGKEVNGYLYIIIGSELYDAAISITREEYVVQTIVKGLLITLFFTGIIGLILFALLTRRLRNMTNVVHDFERGKQDVRIPVKTDDEVGQLATSFNKMADTIVANIEELKNTDKLRRELIANVSHDLRSPLASIRGYLETIQIKDKVLSDEERHKYINILLDSTHGLERLVTQLFELSKLDAKQIEPQPEPFLVKEMVYDVISKFQPKAEKLGITIAAEIKDGLPQVFADIGMIERVLSNLLENAIRYTPEGGKVNIVTESSGEVIRVRVVDNGPGIDQEDLKYIFNRFYRVEKSRSEKTGGTGLGLAIAKKIMEVHKSSISVASEINKGSVFSFNLKTWHQSTV